MRACLLATVRNFRAQLLQTPKRLVTPLAIGWLGHFVPSVLLLTVRVDAVRVALGTPLAPGWRAQYRAMYGACQAQHADNAAWPFRPGARLRSIHPDVVGFVRTGEFVGSNDGEVASVQGRNFIHAQPFGNSDDRGVHRSQGQIAVSVD